MHPISDVRRLDLRAGQTPSEMWQSYRRDLRAALDRVDGARVHAPVLSERRPDPYQKPPV